MGQHGVGTEAMRNSQNGNHRNGRRAPAPAKAKVTYVRPERAVLIPALVLLAAWVVLVFALAYLAGQEASAMDQCQAAHSFDICALTLR